MKQSDHQAFGREAKGETGGESKIVSFCFRHDECQKVVDIQPERGNKDSPSPIKQIYLQIR